MKIGLLGYGDVGAKIAHLIQQNPDLKLVSIGVQNLEKQRSLGTAIFTTDLQSIVTDPTIDLIIEALPGVDLPYQLVELAAQNGKHIITCNKQMVSTKAHDLNRIGYANDVTIYLNSLIAASEEYKTLPIKISHRNILDLDPNDLYGFRGAGGKETAEVMYQDVLINLLRSA